MMKKTVLFAMGLVAVATTHAQNTIESTVSADVVSKYVWRGLELGHAAVQPTLGISYKGFSLTGWGSLGITDASDSEELDLTATYTVGGLTVGITDYWFNTPETRYFLYDARRTSHVFEAGVGYDFGLLSAHWYTNFAGNDGVNKNGDRAYSSYVEIVVPFRLGGADWTAQAGAVPFATTSYEANGFAVTNLSLRATKIIDITKTFSLPLFAGITANPCAQKAYFVFGLTLQP